MWNTILLSMAAGVAGTLLGSAIMLLFNLKNPKTMALMECVSSGFILALVCFDMIPEGLENANLWIVVMGIAVGLLLIVLLEQFLPHHNHSALETEEQHYRDIGLLFLLVLSIHNLPEGMALGSMGAIDRDVPFAILIALHNIPEGMAIATMLLAGGYSKLRTVTLCAAAGLPTVLGAIIGYAVSAAYPAFIGVCLALSAGAMLYLIFEDILEDVFKKIKGAWVAISTGGGLLLGLILIKLL